MLTRSSISTEVKTRNIVESTAAVVFMGTPHRGSPVAAVGELMRSIVSTLRMDTTPVNLDALGLKTTDLERAQESFSRLWYKHDFRVKTFQEGLALTGFKVGALGSKVVPDYSSLLGDYREHAETLQANHMEMCRFDGEDDPNYRKVSGEIRSIYQSLSELSNSDAQRQMSSSISRPGPIQKTPGSPGKEQIREVDRSYLQALWFPSINRRHLDLEAPAEHTCEWLFEHETYLNWLNGQNQDTYRGLLWLKGKPGAGKSVLMKEAFRRASLGEATSNYITAAFFFNAKGDELQHSPIGLLRSLMHQLLSKDEQRLRQFNDEWIKRSRDSKNEETDLDSLGKGELQSIFESIFDPRFTPGALVFIDALDECDEDDIRRQAYFWRRVTSSANSLGVNLSVCISSRHFPTITLKDCPEIVVEQHNNHDIEEYVEQRLDLGVEAQESEWALIKTNILTKAAGVFLWVVLVVDDILIKRDDGKNIRYLLGQIDVLPATLDQLFSDMFSSLDPDVRQLTARVFQWAVLTAKPLRLHEWHHVLAFLRHPPPSSLHDWRESDYFTNDDQLERQIRSISKGLVEVKKTLKVEQPDDGFEMSVRAGAGSLTIEHGDTRIIQVIHHSVREFFLSSNGFKILDPSLESNPIGNSHLSIMATCLDYLNIKELDALVQARQKQHGRNKHKAKIHKPSRGKASGASHSIPRATSWAEDIVQHAMRSGYGRPPRLAKLETRSVFEKIRQVNDSATGVDIDEWMATNLFVAGQASAIGPVSYTTHASLAGQSQMLEDYPALLSYATFELFTHAKLAEEYLVDPSHITSRLSDDNIWARWVLLREDMPAEISMIDYFFQERLDRWLLAASGIALGDRVLDGSLREKLDDITAQTMKKVTLRTQSSLRSSYPFSPTYILVIGTGKTNFLCNSNANRQLVASNRTLAAKTQRRRVESFLAMVPNLRGS
jgi:hypothetical protein